MAKCYKIFILLVFLSSFVLAQNNNYKFNRYTADDGLCSNEVTCITQDDLDFMWIGTYNGLARYDGYEFKIFQHEPNNPVSIPSSTIHYGNVMQKDSYGYLWIGTRSGLARINSHTREVKKIVYDSLNTNILKHYWIQCLLIDQNENIWLGTSGGGLYILEKAASDNIDLKKISILHLTKNLHDENKITDDHIYTIFQDKNGLVWVGSNSGLNCFMYSVDKNTWVLDNNNFPQDLQKERIVEIFQDNDGDLWFGVKNKYLHRYKKGSNNFEEIKKPFLYYIQTIAQDSLGFLWFGSWQNNGLIRYDKEKNEFLKIDCDSGNPNSITNQMILDIYISKNNLIWVATYGSGLYFYDPNKYYFDHIISPKKNSSNATGSFIYAIHEDKRSKLWMVTRGNGVNVYNPENGNIESYSHNPDDVASLSNNCGLCIYEDFSGNIWIGTEWGLNKYNPSYDGFEKFYRRFGQERNNPTHISNNWINAIQQDKDNSYWVATYMGLNRIYLTSGKVDHYWQETNEPNFDQSVITFSIFVDSRGVLWASTYNGLFIADKKNKRLKRFYAFSDSLYNPNQLINNFLEDHEKNLWLGSRSGLIKLDSTRKRIAHYTQKDGLPSNIINSMLDDDYGNLWIGFTKGLIRFNPKSLSIRNYDIHDGLLGMEFYENAACKTKSGLLYFGVGHGITIVDPDKIFVNKHVPAVFVTSLKLLKTENKIEKIFNNSEEIILNYDQNDFLIEFLALNYTSSLKNQYAYQLKGLDNSLIYCNDRRYVSYANVPPGEYEFFMKASNNDGIWNEEGTSVKIIIIPPWWRTNLAYAFYIIFIGLSIWLTWRFQTNRLKMKQQLEIENLHAEKLEEVDRLKSHFFANISHEFRTPLTLILAPIEQLITDTFKGSIKENYVTIRNNAKKILRLVNQLLSLSKMEAGQIKLQVSEQDIIHVFNRIINLFSSLAERKNIDLNFSSPKSLILHFDEEKIETILNNLFSNAFKFTPEGGVVEIVIKHPRKSLPLDKGNKGDCLQITISNTGPHIPSNQIDKIFERFYQIESNNHIEGTGIGLSLTKDLVELHHGKITVESKAEGKTTFTILIPTSVDSYISEEMVVLKKDHSKKEENFPVIESLKTDIDEDTAAIQELPAVLIVEDNEEVRTYLRKNLKEKYNVLEAANGKIGIQKAEQELPDLVISDVMMPEMDGFEFCDKIKSEISTSHIPIILLTARATREDKLEGLKTGADDYLPKPFDLEELSVRVENLINQRKKMKERFLKEALFGLDKISSHAAEQEFVEKITQIINHNINNPDYTVDDFAHDIGMSRAQLFRKVKAWTKLTPHEFIRLCRLKMAAIMLKEKSHNVTEAAFAVGFKSVSHFSKIFNKQFNQTPSSYFKS